MKKYNLGMLRLVTVKNICIHHDTCRACPLFGKDGFCPFMKISPNNWRLE